MSILSDIQIKELVVSDDMIYPFIDRQVKGLSDGNNNLISYGLSSFGYDIRVGREYKVFTNVYGETIIDPKNFSPNVYVEFEGDKCVIPPNSFALARSMEYMKMPADVTGIVLGKSTYARCGTCLNFTPLEAGWEGEITIEISNTTPLPMLIYSNEGIAQVLFFQGDTYAEVTYADRKGKYQGQTGITLPVV